MTTPTTMRERFEAKFSGTHTVLNWNYEECKCDLIDNDERATCEAKILSFIQSEIDLAKEEERNRIENIFKQVVPPHRLSLEDGVWLKRLLNKAFKHEK